MYQVEVERLHGNVIVGQSQSLEQVIDWAILAAWFGRKVAITTKGKPCIA